MVDEYYNEEEFLKAVEDYEKADTEANKVRDGVFSSIRGVLPVRSITDKDIAVMDRSHDAWEKVIGIARRPTRPRQQ